MWRSRSHVTETLRVSMRHKIYLHRGMLLHEADFRVRSRGHQRILNITLMITVVLSNIMHLEIQRMLQMDIHLVNICRHSQDTNCPIQR